MKLTSTIKTFFLTTLLVTLPLSSYANITSGKIRSFIFEGNAERIHKLIITHEINGKLRLHYLELYKGIKESNISIKTVKNNISYSRPLGKAHRKKAFYHIVQTQSFLNKSLKLGLIGFSTASGVATSVAGYFGAGIVSGIFLPIVSFFFTGLVRSIWGWEIPLVGTELAGSIGGTAAAAILGPLVGWSIFEKFYNRHLKDDNESLALMHSEQKSVRVKDVQSIANSLEDFFN